MPSTRLCLDRRRHSPTPRQGSYGGGGGGIRTHPLPEREMYCRATDLGSPEYWTVWSGMVNLVAGGFGVGGDG